MSRTMLVATMVTATLAWSPARGDSPAPGRPILICYTTGSVSARDARPAIETMVRLLERLGGWPEGTYQGRFTDDARECERLVASENPHFVIPSLGFYLRHRKGNGLLPVAQPRVRGRDHEVLRVLVRRGDVASLDALKGRTIGGTLLDDPDYLGRVVFKGRLDPASFFVLKPSKVALRPLRDLAAGKMDAVLVNDQQYRALAGLPFSKDLDVVFESEPLPLPGVFAVERRTSQDERARISKALQSFCGHVDGRSFCELFGMDGFVPADASSYESVRALWEAR